MAASISPSDLGKVSYSHTGIIRRDMMLFTTKVRSQYLHMDIKNVGSILTPTIPRRLFSLSALRLRRHQRFPGHGKED